MTKEERQKRVIARGEHSNHSHVLIGDCEIEKDHSGQTIVKVGNEGAILRHILEKEYIETGEEKWTGEHHDIKLPKGEYKYIQQIMFDPLLKRIQSVKD